MLPTYFLLYVFPKIRFATPKPLSLLCFDHDNAKGNNLRRLPITNINNHCQFQIFAATVIGGFGGINVGAVLAFSAIFLPQLADHVTLSERSWIGKCNIFRTQLYFCRKKGKKMRPVNRRGVSRLSLPQKRGRTYEAIFHFDKCNFGRFCFI